MTIIYSVGKDISDEFDYIHYSQPQTKAVESKFAEFFDNFRGKTHESQIVPPPMKIVKERKRCDIYEEMSTLIFTPNAWEKFQPLLESHAGVFLLPIGSQTLYLLDIKKIIEIKLTRFRAPSLEDFGKIYEIKLEDLKIGEVDKVGFKDALVFLGKEDGDILRGIYATERFKKIYDDSGFRGLSFDIVYSDEPPQELETHSKGLTTDKIRYKIIQNHHKFRDKKITLLDTIYEADNYYWEVANGGLQQFYFNKRGKDLEVTKEALKTIGAIQAVALFDKMLELINSFTKKDVKRFLNGGLFEDESDFYERMDELTHEDTHEEESVHSLVLDFIEKHMEEIRKTGILDEE